MTKKPRVLVAMSGGVDSSVAALLMKKQGYKVIGVFMKNWSNTKNSFGKCAWRDERREALRIAMKLDIPLKTIDHEKEYKEIVIKDMFKNYKKGITPNPDVLCNEKIKFPLLWKEAKKLKCEYLVTGHYARIKKTKDKFEMLRAKDETKDQSYFLFRLKQNDLKHTMFPIGKYTKTKIREIAKKEGFLNYNKKGTVGICFIGKLNLKDFLQTKIKEKKGKIIDPNGNVIGEHDGIYYYTIGQRLGPRYGFDIPRKNPKTQRMDRWYVAKKDAKKNIITAAPENHPILFRKEMLMKDAHFISKNKEEFTKKPTNVLVRIRQVGELMKGTISYNKKEKSFKVKLKKAITGVSEGQAIVLYKKEEVLGGGTIFFKKE